MIAGLTLKLITSNDVENGSKSVQRFSDIAVEAFRTINHNAVLAEGFSLSTELYPPATTSSERSHAGPNKRFSGGLYTNKNLSPMSKLEAVRDEEKGITALDINSPHPLTGDTRLLAAARIGNLADAQSLLNAGADPCIAGNDGSVPLHWLFMFPSPEQEQIGLRLGPADEAESTVHRCVTLPQKLDAQFPITLFGTPLSFAVATANLTTVKALLKLGANPAADIGTGNLTSWHRSPLELAASLHLDTILEHLLTALETSQSREGGLFQLLSTMSDATLFERRCIHGAATAMACRNTVRLICKHLDRLHIEPDSCASLLKVGLFVAISRADTEVTTALVDEFETGFPSSLNIENRAKFIRQAVLLSAVKAHCANIVDPSTTLELIQFAFESGLDAREFNSSPRPFDASNPVFVAIEHQRDDLLKILEESGIDIRVKDAQGRSAFHNIYLKRIIGLSAKTMITLGFDVKELDDDSATPLHYAARYGGPREIEELVSLSASVNACDDGGSTPLHYAVLGRNLPSIDCLLELGADPMIFDAGGMAPVHIAAVDPRCLHGFNHLVQPRFSGAVRTKDGEGCITLAYDSGNELLVKGMLTSEFDEASKARNVGSVKGQAVRNELLHFIDNLTLQPQYGRVALYYAAENGLPNMVSLLCHTASKYDIDAKDRQGRTPLSLAAGNGHTDVARILIDLKPSMIKSRDLEGRTPLSFAAGNGHDETVSELLKHNGTPDLPCLKGRTPLSWAAGNGHINVAKLLVQSGLCDLDLADKLDRTPLSWAASNGHLTMVKHLLRDSGGSAIPRPDCLDWRSPLWWAIQNSHDAVAEAIVDHLYSDVHGSEMARFEFLSLLFKEIQRGHLVVVAFLIRCRSHHVESEDSSGRTALSIAAEAGHVHIVRHLLTVGRAKADVRDRQGHIPLHWAARRGHLAVVTELVQALPQEEVWVKDHAGDTPLSIAQRLGHIAVCAALTRLQSPTARTTGKSDTDINKAGLNEKSSFKITQSLDYSQTKLTPLNIVVTGMPGHMNTSFCIALASNKPSGRDEFLVGYHEQRETTFE